MSDDSLTRGFSSRSLFLIWAGAAISVAEMLSGSVLAPLGMSSGLVAILLGHVIGGVLLYLAAAMSSSLRASAMESTRYSFGIYGSYVFSGFNILQLVGWTSIMMLQGSRILDQITISLYGYSNPNLWMIGIALCISIWLLFISHQHAQLNGLVVVLLLLLSLVMGYRLIRDLSINTLEGVWPTVTFWQGVEVNIAMCLSWLPLIGDYTQHARQTRRGPFWSAVGYSVVGSCMFALGLGLSLATGSSDIALMLTLSGIGMASLFIVFFSTVTTTYLDVYSASDSFMNIWPLNHGKVLSLFFTFISLIIALLLPMDSIEPFLYLIGAIFSPLYSLLFVDYFILHRPTAQSTRWNLTNMTLWSLGVVLYFLMQEFLIDVSNSLLIFLVVGGISVLIKRRQKHV
ncbi:putative hydroxymethylpyrimidine transporter CytX [uncultured Sphaerochaeta sp.]|uniref:putative hydroxymethylpyrimidine transporter CytX n=1 Tax=uncultured Sphaerochaeta sp. TaxID=886478 RepID=UPI002A0A5AE0|nr:putative hydroxymethylpyrimidine transporter CytX [uncultured Sphaerochaeta sp.]